MQKKIKFRDADFSIIINEMRKHKKEIALGSTVIFLLALLVIPNPMIFRHVIDVAIPDGNPHQLLFWVGMLYLSSVVLRSLYILQDRTFFLINKKITNSIKGRILQNIIDANKSERQKLHTYYILGRINTDVTMLQSLLADSIAQILVNTLTAIVALVLLLILKWELAIVVLIILPFFALSAYYFSGKIKKQSVVNQENIAVETQQLNESLNMIDTLVLYLQKKFPVSKYVLKQNKSLESEYKLRNLSYANMMITANIAALVTSATLYFGGLFVMKDTLTIGTIFAFNALAGRILTPVNTLISTNDRIQKALVALDRINSIMNLQKETADDNFAVPEIIESLELKNISFGYSQECNILQDFSININKGEFVAITGESGCGKTTLFNLLTGLYDIDNGEIKINGNTVSKEQLVALRKNIVLVEQEPLIIYDTVLENIRLGDTDFSEENVVNAARLANIHEFIIGLENGYNTLLKQNGSNVSVGQKLRITIARALLRNPSLLLFDESNSSLDTMNEELLKTTIDNLPEHTIVLFITHKKEILRHCDREIVIIQGKAFEKTAL